MKIILFLALSACMIGCKADAQTKPETNLCIHAYYPGCADQPDIRVEKLTAAEISAISRAEAAVTAAETDAKATRERVIESHGGYILPSCGFAGQCMIESGHRLSDDVEWKGDFIILTRKWIPEL